VEVIHGLAVGLIDGENGITAVRKFKGVIHNQNLLHVLGAKEH
jgi:hypothetical protein